ncbi:hypothetical protein ACTXT7_011794 [Hymenolepis weldensis]
MNWPPRGRDNSSIVNVLTHSEHLSSSEECMTWHNGRKCWEVNARHLAKDLQVSEGTTICKECSSPRPQIRYKMTPQLFLQGLSVNADAYVETLQTIVVKLPWIDNVANVFQQDSPPSHQTLQAHDWMDGQEFSSPCHTELLMATS